MRLKRNRLLLLLTLIIFITGCGKETLESSLKEEGYLCQKEVCVLIKEDNVQTTTDTYDINNNIYTVENVYKGFGKQSYNLEYNWKEKNIKVKYTILDSEFDIIYNLEDEKSFKCSSNDDDKVFEKAECSIFKNEIEERIKIVNNLIDKNID